MKIPSTTNHRIALYSLKIFTWTTLLLLGLCAKVGSESIFKLTIQTEVIPGHFAFVKSLVIAFLFLSYSALLFIYALRYLIWVPWRIYRRILPYPFDRQNTELPTSTSIKDGLHNVRSADVIVTLIYLIAEFFVVFYIFSSFENPSYQVFLILALPFTDIVLLLFGSSTRICMVAIRKIKAVKTEKKIGVIDELKRLQKTDALTFFLIADVIDIFLPLGFLYLFHSQYCNDFSPSHMLLHLNGLSINSIAWLNVHLSLGVLFSSCFVIYLYRYKLRNVLLVLLDLKSVEFSEETELITKKFSPDYPQEYVAGYCEFYGYEFIVDKRVYIPTKETEGLVDVVSKRITNFSHPYIVDVGTGCGNIAISLAHRFPEASIRGVDISNEALEVAKINKERHKTVNVELLHSDLILDIDIGKPNVIVANLPWGSKKFLLKSNTPEKLKYMPEIALFPESGLAGHYVKLANEILEKKIPTILVFESGTIPQEKLESELYQIKGLPKGEYIPINDSSYSVYIIDYSKLPNEE